MEKSRAGKEIVWGGVTWNRAAVEGVGTGGWQPLGEDSLGQGHGTASVKA